MGALNLPGGLIPTLTSVVSTFRAAENVFGSLNPRSDDNLALSQLQERQRLAQQQSGQDANLDRERIALQNSQNEETRRAALRRAVARQRAQFGSSGIASGTGGSADAVLLGLFDETEDELTRRNQLDNLRNRALDLNLNQQRSVNVLQATQLSERQNLGRLF